MKSNIYNERKIDYLKIGDNKFKKGEENFEKLNYKDAIKNYNDAKNDFLMLEGKGKFKAFECVAEITKCKVNATGITIKKINWEDYINTPYEKIILDLKSEILNIKSKIFASLISSDKEDRILTYYQCCNIIVSIYKNLEKFLYDLGLTDEASEMYFEANVEKTEKLKFEKKIFYEKWYQLGKIKYDFIIFWRRAIWELLFGFFIKPWRILGSVIIGMSLFSLIYWFFGLVGYQPNNFDNYLQLNSHTWSDFGHCLYFSVVSITSLGSEVHIPWGLAGKIFQCIEAIFGYGILGAIVAYLTRKIK